MIIRIWTCVSLRCKDILKVPIDFYFLGSLGSSPSGNSMPSNLIASTASSTTVSDKGPGAHVIYTDLHLY